MQNIIYDYPKSSCITYECNKNKYQFNDSGTPTNIGTIDCSIPPLFDCYDKVVFNQNIQPINNNGYTYINPQLANQTFDKTFQKVNCNNNYLYTSPDPRLISTIRGKQTLFLDRPPYNYSVKLKDIYTDSNLTNYGKNYKSYSDINAGQIMYYTDHSQEEAFFNPNFTDSAGVTSYLFRDPMGSIKPQYDRYPLKGQNPITSDKYLYDHGLSSLDDSEFFRQDIMSKQMSKMNQSKWSSRWLN